MSDSNEDYSKIVGGSDGSSSVGGSGGFSIGERGDTDDGLSDGPSNVDRAPDSSSAPPHSTIDELHREIDELQRENVQLESIIKALNITVIKLTGEKNVWKQQLEHEKAKSERKDSTIQQKDSEILGLKLNIATLKGEQKGAERVWKEFKEIASKCIMPSATENSGLVVRR